MRSFLDYNYSDPTIKTCNQNLCNTCCKGKTPHYCNFIQQLYSTEFYYSRILCSLQEFYVPTFTVSWTRVISNKRFNDKFLCWCHFTLYYIILRYFQISHKIFNIKFQRQRILCEKTRSSHCCSQLYTYIFAVFTE